MAKQTPGDGEDKQDNGDAPLIELNEAQLKKLIARAKKRGYISVDELNATVGEMSTDQIEDIMAGRKPRPPADWHDDDYQAGMAPPREPTETPRAIASAMAALMRVDPARPR